MANEFRGTSFDCPIRNQTFTQAMQNVTVAVCQCTYPDLNNDCKLSGEEILAYFTYSDVKIWGWILILLAMALFFRIIFYLLLRFANKGKR